MGPKMDMKEHHYPEFDTGDLPFKHEQQHRLYRALRDLNHSLALFYLGTHQVLADKSNVDRFALAAHGFREIMRRAPRVIDVPVEEDTKENYNLGEAVRDMEER